MALLEELHGYVSRSYAGITSAHASLARCYIATQSWDKAQRLCDATSVNATDFAYIASFRNVLEYLYEAGAIYTHHGVYARACAMYATVRVAADSVSCSPQIPFRRCRSMRTSGSCL